jgi:hypothetical protein
VIQRGVFRIILRGLVFLSRVNEHWDCTTVLYGEALRSPYLLVPHGVPGQDLNRDLPWGR